MTQINEQQQQYPHWHDFVAGAAAGAGARILTHPLDLIRIRRQLAHVQAPPQPAAADAAATLAKTMTNQQPHLLQAIINVVRNEGGIPALFRGNVPAMSLWITYTGVQFASYGHVRDYVATKLLPGENNRGAVAFVSGACAGVAATLSTYPLDLCRTVFAARGAETDGGGGSRATTATSSAAGRSSVANHWSVWSAAAKAAKSNAKPRPPESVTEFASNLFARQGWKGFYAGCLPTVIQIVPYMGCSFYIYDALTREDRGVGMSAYAGSIAGAVSKMLVYPMDTVKKRLQAQAFFGAHDVHRGQLQLRYYSGMVDCIVTINQTEGLKSFYRGLWPSVLKTSLAAGLSFAMFRTTKNALESIHDNGGLFASVAGSGRSAEQVNFQAEEQIDDVDDRKQQQRGGGQQKQHKAEERSDDDRGQQQQHIVAGGVDKSIVTDPPLARDVSSSSSSSSKRPAAGDAGQEVGRNNKQHEHRRKEQQQDYRSLLKRRPTTHFD